MSPQTVHQRQVHPLKKVSKELFEHGEEHNSRNSSFDRLVAGVHVDNALELFLKFYGVTHNISGYQRKLVPELIRLLEPHIPELNEFGGDLRTFHDLRDVAYHMGQPLDEYNLNWGLERIKLFIGQVEDRERQRAASLPDGGTRYNKHKKSKAEEELETAVRLFHQLPPDAQKEQTETILLHMFKAVEYWLDDRLRSSVGRKEISRMSLGEKIEILKQEIKDSVLLSELRQIGKLRNIVTHAKEVRIEPDEVYKYLQIVTHFVKVESPRKYAAPTPSPLHKTLTGIRVKSKSEVIIANILTYLGIDYEYEKPLPSRKDTSDFRVPDFTIIHNGEVFYWEHLSRVYRSDLEHRRLWRRKKKWYEANGYTSKLIVSRETANGVVDSENIRRLAKEKVLGFKS